LSRLRKVLVATLALVLALLIWVLAFPSEASEHLADAAPVGGYVDAVEKHCPPELYYYILVIG
jgi:hypothetical protein